MNDKIEEEIKKLNYRLYIQVDLIHQFMRN